MHSANNSEVPTVWRSRLAPTPSGFLHLGNAYNFLLTWLWIRRLQGELWLRVDDFDHARMRPEYVEDLFSQLDWLGLDYDHGPQSPQELQQEWSQRLRQESYATAFQQLRQTGDLYRCTCSRRQWQALAASERYPGTCRLAQHPDSTVGSWRLRLPESAPVSWSVWPAGEDCLDLSQEMGDFVVWRRDALPAYQLVSAVDDLNWQINLIVRGLDLQASTAAQHWLTSLLAPQAPRAAVLHHPLLTDPAGSKLSKSDGALSLRQLRFQGHTPAPIYRAFARWQSWPEADSLQSLHDLQQSFALALEEEP